MKDISKGFFVPANNDERKLMEYAIQAATGATEEERLMAASVLLLAVAKATRENEFLKSRPRLSVVKDLPEKFEGSF